MATAAVAGPPSQWVFVSQFTYDLIKGNKDILYLIGNVLALTFIENDCTAFNCLPTNYILGFLNVITITVTMLLIPS